MRHIFPAIGHKPMPMADPRQGRLEPGGLFDDAIDAALANVILIGTIEASVPHGLAETMAHPLYWVSLAISSYLAAACVARLHPIGSTRIVELMVIAFLFQVAIVLAWGMCVFFVFVRHLG